MIWEDLGGSGEDLEGGLLSGHSQVKKPLLEASGRRHSGGSGRIWRGYGEDMRGYERIWEDMGGYGRIMERIAEDLGGSGRIREDTGRIW